MGISGILLGILGGVVGGAIWAKVFLATNKEYAWLASAIGALVGAGAFLGSGQSSGVYSVGITVSTLALAKVLALRIMSEKLLTGIIGDAVHDKSTALLAREVMGEERRRGRHLDWAGDDTSLDRVQKKHFPDGVWRMAADRLDALSPQERADLEGLARHGVGEISPLIRRSFHVILLKSNFNWKDMLLNLIASLTAYAFGSGFVFE